MSQSKKFVEEVEAFLKESGMTATVFGKAAVNDPKFVFNIREGRQPSLRLVDRVNAYVKSVREGRTDDLLRSDTVFRDEDNRERKTAKRQSDKSQSYLMWSIWDKAQPFERELIVNVATAILNTSKGK
jgi:hypothetical protein